jgi:hypothetical protein
MESSSVNAAPLRRNNLFAVTHDLNKNVCATVTGMIPEHACYVKGDLKVQGGRISDWEGTDRVRSLPHSTAARRG